jgi:hypothetical protein
VRFTSSLPYAVEQQARRSVTMMGQSGQILPIRGGLKRLGQLASLVGAMTQPAESKFCFGERNCQLFLILSHSIGNSDITTATTLVKLLKGEVSRQKSSRSETIA